MQAFATGTVNGLMQFGRLILRVAIFLFERNSNEMALPLPHPISAEVIGKLDDIMRKADAELEGR